MTITGTTEQTPQQMNPEMEQQTQQEYDDLETNVGSNERLLSLAGGALLVLFGVRRRSLPGALLAVAGGMMIQRGWTGHCSVYQAMGMNSNQDGAEPEEYFERGIHVEQSVTVQRSPEELFAYWRNFENLPRIMNHLESVTVQDGNRSHWVAKAPAGKTVEWDAEIINEEPNRVIAWRSLGNADVDNAGSVRFLEAPGGGTEVRVVIDYIPPAGRVGAFVAGLFGENPEQQIQDDLNRFKQQMETGDAGEASGAAQVSEQSTAT
jgi:uncharacterized membrane protein